MKTVDIRSYDKDKIIIELTQNQAKLLYDLIGHISGYDKTPLKIERPEELDTNSIKDLLNNPLYKKLNEILFT